MAEIAMTRDFVSALAALDGADAKRAAAFMEKLLREPSAAGLNTEIVHDAGDRSVRSMRVTQDLRAIVCLEADRVVLLFVARHDVAYSWARGHCVRCHPFDGTLEVVRVEAEPTASAPAAAVHAEPATVECVVVDGESLCEVLDANGIPHELTP